MEPTLVPTKKVGLKNADGQEVTINVADFNPEEHEELAAEKPKAAAKPSADAGKPEPKGAPEK